MNSVVLHVPEISCKHCAQSIVAALGGEVGVETVTVDVDTQSVHLVYDPAAITFGRVQEIMEAEEYPIESTHVVSGTV